MGFAKKDEAGNFIEINVTSNTKLISDEVTEDGVRYKAQHPVTCLRKWPKQEVQDRLGIYHYLTDEPPPGSKTTGFHWEEQDVVQASVDQTLILKGLVRFMAERFNVTEQQVIDRLTQLAEN